MALCKQSAGNVISLENTGHFFGSPLIKAHSLESLCANKKQKKCRGYLGYTTACAMNLSVGFHASGQKGKQHQ